MALPGPVDVLPFIQKTINMARVTKRKNELAYMGSKGGVRLVSDIVCELDTCVHA